MRGDSSTISSAKMTKQKINVAKVVKFVGIFVLGCVVFATKHAYESRNAALQSESLQNRQERSLTYNSIDQKAEKETFPEPVADKLQAEDDLLTKTVYKIEAKPQAVIYPHNPRERTEFLSKMKKHNVTRWQYPDYVHVPLSDLGVVFLNGQRFFRQGTGTPPEFRANETSADTRAVTEHKCGLGYHKEKSVESLISARRLPTNEPSENKPPAQQVGCCNGLPYNSNKRCCCRRASFDKDTKFCCAVNGCQDFRIFKRDDLTAREKCTELNGIVVEEYGYHSGASGPTYGQTQK